MLISSAAAPDYAEIKKATHCPATSSISHKQVVLGVESGPVLRRPTNFILHSVTRSFLTARNSFPDDRQKLQPLPIYCRSFSVINFPTDWIRSSIFFVQPPAAGPQPSKNDPLTAVVQDFFLMFCATVLLFLSRSYF